MKRITIKTITLLAAALSLAACSKDEHNAPDSAHQVEITTRLSAQNDGGSAITPGGDTAPAYAPTVGTEIALYYAHVGNAQRALFRYDADGNWQCARQLFWDHLDPPAGADHFPFFAASPQTPDAQPAVVPDQNNADAYRLSDQLFAYTTAANRRERLNLNFRHVLAQLKIELESPAGDDHLDLSQVTLRVTGARLAYTLAYTGTDAATTAVAPSESTPAIATATDDAADLVPLTVSRSDAAGRASFLAILPPQTASLKFIFTVAGKTYTYDDAKNALFAAGRNTSYKLTISKSDLALDGITLEPWDDSQPATEGSINADGIKDITTTISGIDQPGTLYLAATDPAAGTVAAGGLGIYPLEIGADGNAVSSDLSRAILWDNLASGSYVYRALYAPAAYRHGATDEDNHERDYLTAASAATPWGTAPSFAGTNGTALKHATAQLTVSLISTDGSFTPAELAGAGITTFSLRSAAPDTESATLAFTTLSAEKAVRLRPAGSDRPASKTALIAPQTLTRVVIAIGDKTYTLTRALELSANATSTLEVNVQRTALGFTVNVTDWNTQDTIHGGDVSVDD